MIIHPQFDPVLLELGPVSIRWYAVSYIVGFLLFFWIGSKRLVNNSVITKKQLSDFFTWGVVGVILGGRLGYVLFYQFSYYINNPVHILKVWEGGMSFHGGFLGVVVAILLFSYKNKINFLKFADFVAPLAPLGLACGRIGNFINGELWGRVTDINAFWAMGFPQAHLEDIAAAQTNELWGMWIAHYGLLPRHPSQLYEFALEGVLLFIILNLFAKRNRPSGQVSMLFLVGYGFFRFIIEFARQPDDYLGLLQFNLSMGQWLSIPMIIVGVIGFIYFGKKNHSVR